MSRSKFNTSKQQRNAHKHAEKLQRLQSKRPKKVTIKPVAEADKPRSPKLTLLQQVLLVEMTLFVIALFLARASQNSADSRASFDIAMLLKDSLPDSKNMFLPHYGQQSVIFNKPNRTSPLARSNNTQKSIKELQALVKKEEQDTAQNESKAEASLPRKEVKSRFKKSLLTKPQTVKEVVESVCHEIHQQGYHAYNNPAQSTFSIKDNKFAVSIPKHILRNKIMVHMEGFRTIVGILMKESWDTMIASMREESQSAFEQIVVDPGMRQLIKEYLSSLETLHDLRIQSACFEQLEGGTAGEFNAHVSYMMARSFHELNMNAPGITRLGLKDPRRPRVEIFHGVSLIDGEPRQRYGRFFEPANPAHQRGFICDPWLHQVEPVTEMNEIEDHPMLSNNVSNYTVASSEEVGIFPDISSLPSQIRTLLEQRRAYLMDNQFAIPDDAAKNILLIRDSLQANEMPPEESVSSLSI